MTGKYSYGDESDSLRRRFIPSVGARKLSPLQDTLGASDRAKRRPPGQARQSQQDQTRLIPRLPPARERIHGEIRTRIDGRPRPG